MSANNHVVLVGRLTKDPELRYTANGTALAQFILAVDRLGQNETDFIPIVAFGRLAEIVDEYVTKGMQVIVLGSIRVHSWTNERGERRYRTEVLAERIQFVGYSKRNDSDSHNIESVSAEAPEAAELPPF